MKNFALTIIVLLAISFTSCKKEEITPGNYPPNEAPKPAPNDWQNDYTNGGVINNGTAANNELVGTTWVLTEHRQIGYTTYYPNDTIRFISNTQYTIQNSSKRTYTLSTNVASTNKTLTLNYFYPFGGSHYSAEIGGMFVTDGVIISAVFKNLQNSTPNVIANFKKI